MSRLLGVIRQLNPAPFKDESHNEKLILKLDEAEALDKINSKTFPAAKVKLLKVFATRVELVLDSTCKLVTTALEVILKFLTWLRFFP